MRFPPVGPVNKGVLALFLCSGAALWIVAPASAAETPAPATFSVADVSVFEGNSGTATLTFVITRSTSVGRSSVGYAVTNGTAQAGTDYVAVPNSGFLFSDGETTKSVAVFVNGDTAGEPDETLKITLSQVSGATIADGVAIGTILNDDIPKISVRDASVTEGDTGTKTLTFVVTREAISSSSSVQYATADGTASAGRDYVALLPTPLGFSGGETSKTVTVTVNGDTSVEADETFTLNLSAPVGATIVDGLGTGTIRNDDTPELSVDDVTVTEGDSGSAPLTFTITRTGGAGVTSSVQYEFVNGTALAGQDYATVITTTPLNFAPNQTTANVTVAILGDKLLEPDETFTLRLLNPVGATIVRGESVAAIKDDDEEKCTLSVSDASETEGQSGARLMKFTVARTGNLLGQCSVDYATVNHTATSGSDYVALPATTLSFGSNQISKNISVTINGDTVVEPDEVLRLNLFNPNEAEIGRGVGLGTIVNDDFDTTFRALDGSQAEGNIGSPLLLFSITRSGSSGAASVVYTTADASATGGSDYVAVGPTTLNFAEGQTARLVAITLIPDTVLEPDETFTLNLSSPVGGTILDGSATGTIQNDDNPPQDATLSINDVTVVEGTVGTGIGPGGVATFTITRAGSLTGASSVNVATAAGTARSTQGAAANDTADFSAPALVSVTFAPNQSVATITRSVIADAFVEDDETFFLNLSDATGATIADAQGQATIVNDDQHDLHVANFDPSVAEGNAGTTTMQFTVFRSTFGSQGASVAYTISNGSATAGSDYVAVPSGTLIFGSQDHMRKIDITINGDTNAEPDETFFLTLSSPVNGVITDGSATATIVNDDTTLAINDVSIAEGRKDETRTLTFTVTRTGGTSGTTSVTYATANASAFAGSDFVGIVPTILTFSPGETTKTVPVTIIGDGDPEANETFSVNLSAPVGAVITDSNGVGTIINDD